MKKVSKEIKKVNIVKILKILLIILIIFLVANLLMIFCTPLGKAYKTIRYINSDKVEKNTIPIGNTSYWYSEYKGKIDSSVIDKSAYYFSNTLIPEYYKIENVKEYYKKYKKAIRVLLGIKDYDNFNLLVTKIKSLKGDNLNFEKYFIIQDSTTNKENALETVIAIQYEGNDVLLFTLEISNKPKTLKTPVVYSANLDKEYTADRDDTIVDKESYPGNQPGKVLN
ncbi:MAG: hypothetical protein J6K45_01035 [Clostridia bacterium]|nr:hypothetical protein [Clostridia bacterium]